MEKTGAGEQGKPSLLPVLGILFVTVVYLGFELRYNRGLLELFSQVEINQKAIDDLSIEGKVLASVGLVWALLRGVVARVRHLLAKMALFAAASGAVYAALSATYDHVIQNLAAETKVDGFHLAAYRRALLEGSVVDPDVPLPAKYGALGSVFMVSIPLILFDDRYLVPARSILELRAKVIEDYYWKKVDTGWAKYDRQMRLVRASYQQYVDGSRRVEATPALLRSRARNQFHRESGGMLPNSRASMSDFLSELSRSSSAAARQYREAQQEIVFIEREGTPDATPVRGSDLPKLMNQEQFRQFFGERIAAARLELLPTPGTVERTARINDINSSVFVPPMAMATSLLTILANTFNALWIVITFPLQVIRPFASSLFARSLRLLAPLFTLCAIVLLLVFTRAFVFPERTPMRQLEQSMHSRMGTAGILWSRAAVFQSWLYQSTGFVGRG